MKTLKTLLTRTIGALRAIWSFICAILGGLLMLIMVLWMVISGKRWE